jgi:hypothetical protein
VMISSMAVSPLLASTLTSPLMVAEVRVPSAAGPVQKARSRRVVGSLAHRHRRSPARSAASRCNAPRSASENEA